MTATAPTQVPSQIGTRRGVPLRSAAGRVGLYVLLVAVTAVWAAPFLWALVTSLKPESEIFRYPVTWLPSHPILDYYTGLVERFPMGRWFRNSLIVAAITTALTLVLDALAAYPLARMRFRGRRLVMLLILATFLLPVEILLVPLFLGLSRWGEVDSFFSLSVPPAVNAFGVFLLTQFFRTVPSELEDAAIVDGSTRFGFFWRILLPLSRPALITVAIFTFVGSWNNFFWPLIVTTSDETRTLPVGISALVVGTGMSDSYGISMAAAVVSTVPALIFFLALQRYFVRGIATSGLKG
jgi:multiple sugar transport system permease protein